jgi:putative aldouronate transport system substrate-binding protein
MKKLMVATLCILMVVAFTLTGCTNSNKVDQTETEAPAKIEEPANNDGQDTPASSDALEPITYSFLKCWNGGAADFPDGFQDGAIYKAIVEKTGVSLDVQTIVSSEREKLATIFASGDLPDITDAPHWNTNPGGEGELIKNAALEGLILPLNGLYEEFPNVKRCIEQGISDVYKTQHVEHPDYNGERYVIPTQTPRGNDDVRNWAYNLFCRGDILEALGKKGSDITTQEDVYELLKAIKEGDFKDINGKPVIPGGTWHNGWNWYEFVRGFSVGGFTGWDLIDGEPVAETMNDLEIERLQFMQKLVKEGLFDPSCLSQSDTEGKEKMVTGRVAVFGCHYPNQYGFFSGTLLVTNPEMKYEVLGPILNTKGEKGGQNERIGRSGSPVLFLSAKIEQPKRALGFIDFINSDEGLVLGTKGVEGVHFEYDGDVPKFNEEWEKIQVEDPTRFAKEGFKINGAFVGADPRIGWGWDTTYTEEGYVYAREVNPLNFFTGKTFDDLSNEWEGKAKYDEKMSLINWGDEQKRAILSDTPEEVVEIVEQQRQRMIDAGYNEMVEYIKHRLAEDPTIVY